MLINAGGKKYSGLCVYSYNSRGFGKNKQEFCEYLVSESVAGNKIPILCNQENFILKGNSYKISQSIPGFHFIINPAVKETQDKGRAKNGMFIAFPESIKNRVQDVSPGNWRIQAAIIKCSTSNILIINSYFPVDKMTVKVDGTELSEIIQFIKQIIENNEFSNLLLLGDINCDFIRRTGHTKDVSSFVEECSLVKSWEKFEIDFTLIHEIKGKSFTSTIDHFFWNQGFDNCISECGVLHSVDNNSDHSPIYCVIDDEEIEACAPKLLLGKEKPSWKKADQIQKQNYSAELDRRLGQLYIPRSLTECKDVHCKDSSHIEESDQFMTSLLFLVETSAFETLPITKPHINKLKKCVPGWAENVRPFRENAHFWSQVWKSADRPINTELHKIMKRTRNIYHYQVKKCKKSEDIIKRNKLLDACVNGNGNIFTEIKKMRKSKPVVATSMDNENDDIPNHFKGIYSKLYNSVNDKDELEAIQSEVENNISFAHLNDVEKVTAEIVKEAAGCLKDNKTDPICSFSSDCLKKGPDSLFKYLSLAIKSYLIHGHVSSPNLYFLPQG